MPGRYFGLAIQPVAGTPPSFQTENPVIKQFISATDESIGEDRGIIAEEEMGQRGMNKPVPGGFKPDGGLNIWAEPENMDLLLYLLFGTVATTEPTAPANGDYMHTFNPGDIMRYATMFIGTDIGTAEEERRYIGGALKSLKFTAAPEKKLLVSPDFFGRTMKLTTVSAPTFSALDPFYFKEGTLSMGGAPNAKVISCEMEVMNKFKEDDFRLGDMFRVSAPIGGLEAKGTVDLMFEDQADYKDFLDAGGGVAPDGITKQALKLVFDTGIAIAAGVNYLFSLELKNCIFNTHKAPVSKQEPIIETFTFTCYAPTAGDQIEAILQNAHDDCPDWT